MNIDGKVALVTGGAHRVGGAITRALAEAGARVAFTYHQSDKAALALTADLTAAGGDVLPLACDVADWSSVQEMATALRTTFGTVEIIVNGASLFARTPLPTTDISAWSRITAVGIDGPFYVCNALLPAMQRQAEGVIINIIDTSVWKPWPGFLAHAAAKGALLAMTRQLAVDLAPTIRVNGVAPGPVLPPDALPEVRRAALAQQTLLKRWGRAEDVADAVLYLVQADFVTGEIITVDGGERFART